MFTYAAALSQAVPAAFTPGRSAAYENQALLEWGRTFSDFWGKTVLHNREFKHDVYGRRQTAKVNSDFLFFSCNPYINHTKI